MDLTNYKITEVHISTIKGGDAVICSDGIIRTVSEKFIKRGFCGITLYGDSYNLGTIPIKKIILRQ